MPIQAPEICARSNQEVTLQSVYASGFRVFWFNLCLVT